MIYDYHFDGGGGLAFNKVEKYFPYRYDVEKVNKWQSFCVTYDAMLGDVKVYIDGGVAFDAQNMMKVTSFGSFFKVGFCVKRPLRGQMTDFNAWTRLS